jgi:BirA family transcriptional regulator, biotin operon repressor / biotin---[acetyl-CoA-carboxylase] ligase
MPEAYLDAAAIRASTVVRHVEIHDSLGSTNDRAAELVRDSGVELPALIVARHQTAGRGRGNNNWWSADGALTFTVLLNPSALGIGTRNWPQLSLTTAVAVCDALQVEVGTGSSVGIKWPNDIMLDGRKVCGILIESPGGAAPAKDRLLIGIGINVNNSLSKTPRELQDRATSLCDASGCEHSAQQVLIRVLDQIQRQLIHLAHHDPRLPLAWQRLCWLSQRSVSIHDGPRRIEGICTGIAEDGALLIQTGSTTNRFYSGILRLSD